MNACVLMISSIHSLSGGNGDGVSIVCHIYNHVHGGGCGIIIYPYYFNTTKGKILKIPLVWLAPTHEVHGRYYVISPI